MAELMKTLLLTSCAGTVLAAFLALCRPLTKKVFSAHWHYYMWLLVLCVMVMPIRFTLPVQSPSAPIVTTDKVPRNLQSPITEHTPETPGEPLFEEKSTETPEQIGPTPIFTESRMELLANIWLAGAAFLLIGKALFYLIFLLRIRLHSQTVDCPALHRYTSRRVKTRISDAICSPLIVGLFRPTLILPATDMTDEQLHYVLQHETTHLKRLDIGYKWFVAAVKCVHWFNPAIYLIAKQINLDCEISCDMAVVKNLSKTEISDYVGTILALLSAKNKRQIPLTTGMTGNKKSLQKRFLTIKNTIQVSAKMKILSALIACLLFCGAVFAVGLANGHLHVPQVAVAENGTDARETTAFNLLMIGVDNSGRADTIIVFNYSGTALTGLTIPRRTQISLPGDDMQDAYSLSELLAKEDGIEKAVAAIKNTLQIPIHYYAKVNIQAVEDVVDSVGGLTFEIPYDMQYDDPAQDLHIHLPAGKQLLTGEQVGHLMRFRERSHPLNGDELRMLTWHSVMQAYMEQVLFGDVMPDMSALYETATKNIVTNYTLHDLQKDFKSIQQIDRNHIIFEILPVQNAVGDNGYFICNINMADAIPLLSVFRMHNPAEDLVSVVTYTNEVMGFTLTLPERWKSRYEAIQFDNQVAFFHKDIFYKYGKGSGCLFRITKVTPETAETWEDGADPYRTLYWSKDYTYIWSVATDVQYPSWEDRDAEDDRLAEDFRSMMEDLNFIKNSFTPFDDDLQTPVNAQATASLVQPSIAETVPAQNPQPTNETNTATASSQAKRRKIKSTEVADMPYAGFEHLVLENMNAQALENELIRQGVTKSRTSAVDLSQQYLAHEYSYQNNLHHKNGNITCDANGNISLYVSANNDNLIDVRFYDSETEEDVGQYNILGNNENAYTFIGFDPQKTYTVEIQGQTQDAWQIEGTYIIY